jgi:phage terminase large subunit
MKGMTRIYRDSLAAYLRGVRVVANKGGTRSSKTYSVVQLLIVIAYFRQRGISIVSESFPHLRRGVMKDFAEILDKENLVEGVNYEFNKSEYKYTFKNGSVVEFFSVDNWGKVKGSRRDILFINECNRISYETYRQLAVRTTETIFLDWNPDNEFWYEEHIAGRETTKEIHSTYLDNPYLDKAQIAEIESNRYNEQWWRVYGLGLMGYIEGTIYRPFIQIDELPEARSRMRHVYGLDFGYSNDPTALVDVYIDEAGRKIYVDEIIYETGLLNSDIAQRMAEAGISKATEIFADAAEPKSVDEIGRKVYRYNVKPAYKKDLLSQIQFLQQFEIYVTTRSLNVIKESRQYKWKEDRDGNAVNEPIDAFNHAMDALRYAVFTALRKQPKTLNRAGVSRLPAYQ